MLNPEKFGHENLTGLFTSPARCTVVTLPWESHFQQYYSYTLLKPIFQL